MPINQKGRVLLVLILVGLGAVLSILSAYYLIAQQNRQDPSVSQQVTPPQSLKANNDWTEYKTEKIAENSLKAYVIKYPADWLKAVKRDESSNVLNLSKEGYTIEITQGPMGGWGCIFEGDFSEQGAYEDYRDTPYIELESNLGILRRVAMKSYFPGMSMFRFCVKTNDGYFGSPTQVGAITYIVPIDSDETMLEQMDNIISTVSELPDEKS